VNNFNEQYNVLQNVLSNLLEGKQDYPSNATGIFGRIYCILKDKYCRGSSCAFLDLIVLIRNVLSIRSTIVSDCCLRVPRSDSWPIRQDWETNGVNVISEDKQSFFLCLQEWNPVHLSVHELDVFNDVYKGVYCRRNLRCHADIIFQKVTGYESYSSEGQQEAIRSILYMKPGTTLLVNLPTGSGKSLVGYFPSLINQQFGNMTLFVVPTVSLAMDQEREFKAFMNCNMPLAWHAGLSEENKQLIKTNICSGKQTILFTSPESVRGSLLLSLFKAATNGYLKYFIIDEAHLVSQWGDDFRPDFQALAGVWQMFKRECPNEEIKTILMTATLTDETLVTLERLFDLNNHGHIVSYVYLRNEPRYIFKEVGLKNEKIDFIHELLKYGPRPYLLYVNKPEDAETLLETVRGMGYVRVETFHGKTPSQKRQKIIDQWSDNSLDGIIATSAFGVGINKEDVRMVIHASIPESLDRYYQEVGRGGRDGRPSLAVLVYSSKDVHEAKSMINPKIISTELGFKRWETLVNNSTKIESNESRYKLKINSVPLYQSQQSDLNIKWNLGTILLLVRAMVIKLNAVAPEETSSEEEFGNYFNEIVVEITNSGHLLKETWENNIAKVREESFKRGQRNFNLLKDVISSKKEMGEALVELYSVKRDKFTIDVSWDCGGCAKCLLMKKKQIFSEPNIFIPQDVTWIEHDKILKVFPAFSVDSPIIIYSEKFKLENLDKLYMLIEELVSEFNFKEIKIPSESQIVKQSKFVDIIKKYNVLNSFLDLHYDWFCEIKLPLISYLYPWSNVFPEDLLYKERPLHIIFVDKEIKDFKNIGRNFIDTYDNKISLESFEWGLKYVFAK